MPNKNYQSERREYQFSELNKNNLSKNPYSQFKQWLDIAIKETADPTAMTLSTTDKYSQPHARIVLLKSFDSKGFVFYTQYNSEKGQDIKFNPKVSLLFFWSKLDRQIRINGKAEKIPYKESKLYFHSRPRSSQIAATISCQSKVVKDRKHLETLVFETKQQFDNKPIPLPDDWGGYRIKAETFEFWQGRPNRLHDRFRYQLDKNNNWTISRLYP